MTLPPEQRLGFLYYFFYIQISIHQEPSRSVIAQQGPKTQAFEAVFPHQKDSRSDAPRILKMDFPVPSVLPVTEKGR